MAAWQCQARHHKYRRKSTMGMKERASASSGVRQEMAVKMPTK